MEDRALQKSPLKVIDKKGQALYTFSGNKNCIFRVNGLGETAIWQRRRGRRNKLSGKKTKPGRNSGKHWCTEEATPSRHRRGGIFQVQQQRRIGCESSLFAFFVPPQDPDPPIALGALGTALAMNSPCLDPQSGPFVSTIRGPFSRPRCLVRLS